MYGKEEGLHCMTRFPGELSSYTQIATLGNVLPKPNRCRQFWNDSIGTDQLRNHKSYGR